MKASSSFEMSSSSLADWSWHGGGRVCCEAASCLSWGGGGIVFSPLAGAFSSCKAGGGCSGCLSGVEGVGEGALG